MFNRIPSASSISKWFDQIDNQTARTIRAILKGDKSPSDNPDVVKWVAQCFNPPREKEQILCAVNQLLGGFGVEVIRGRWVNNYYGDIQAEYVNQGDTYAPTLLHDTETDNIILTTWGDWVEAKTKVRELV